MKRTCGECKHFNHGFAGMGICYARKHPLVVPSESDFIASHCKYFELKTYKDDRRNNHERY